METEVQNWWLFSCDLGDMKNKEQSKYFRDMKGYKKVERRTTVEKVYEKKGFLSGWDVKWIGGGSFMVWCLQRETFDIVDKMFELNVKFKLFKCEEITKR